jgi:hypothetical protein
VVRKCVREDVVFTHCELCVFTASDLLFNVLSAF